MQADSKTWWSSRRLRYNIALLCAGFAAFISYVAIAGIFPQKLPCVEITAFTVGAQGVSFILAVGLANLFYQLGPASESIFKPGNPVLFRQAIFSAGFWFSVALPFMFPLSIALEALGIFGASRCE